MNTVGRIESDLALLNSRFGAPGRIAFRPGVNNLPIAALAAPGGGCEISLYGGHVLNFRPVGHSPVLFMSKSAVFEPGKPIRGGIPVCWPWFGPSEQGLHGTARVSEWCVDRTEYAGERTELRLRLFDAPEGIQLFLSVAVDKKLSLELTTINLRSEPFRFSDCLHAYFAVSNIDKVAVRGADVGEVRFDAEYDKGFDQVGQDGFACRIEDGGAGRAIIVEADDAGSVQIWNPWIEKSKRLPDLGDEDYKRFVCVEPGNMRTNEIVLAPGAAHTTSLRISAELEEWA